MESQRRKGKVEGQREGEKKREEEEEKIGGEKPETLISLLHFYFRVESNAFETAKPRGFLLWRPFLIVCSIRFVEMRQS